MCHNVLEGESEWCGQKAQCPYCQQDFDIPEFTPKDDTTTAVEPPPPPKKHPTKWLYATVVTFFILCAVLAIFSVVLAYIIPPKSTHPRAKSEPSANINAEQGKQQTKVDSNVKNVPSPAKTSTKTTNSKISNNQPQVKKPAKKTTSNPATKSVALKKPQTSVEPPKKRDYLGNMGFEELVSTLSDFRDCSCGDCHKRFSSFFKEKWEADDSLSTLQHIVCIPKCVNVPNLSYGQKKQILLKRYKDVIAYLNELYNTPITQLNDKYMGGKHVKYKEYGGVVRNFSPVPKFPVPACWCHTKFLAERGCTRAQLAMGFNDGYIDIDSLKWAKKAASRGDAKACFLLGHWCCEKSIDFDMYRGPIIKNTDLMKTAIDWLKRGSSMCDLDCSYELGKIAMEYLHNGTLALQWFEPAAKMKHGDSIHMCAIIYSKAYGSSLENEVACQNVKPNYRRAIMYYEQLIGMYRNDRNVKGIISECKNLVRNLKSRLED